jgi:hypothetical protein
MECVWLLYLTTTVWADEGGDVVVDNSQSSGKLASSYYQLKDYVLFSYDVSINVIRQHSVTNTCKHIQVINLRNLLIKQSNIIIKIVDVLCFRYSKN